MINKVNLFIPIEIKNRDYASRSLVAFESSLQNFNVYIGRKSELDKFVFKKNPGIYFGLVTTETYLNVYKKLKKYGHYIFINDEEGLITFSDKMYLNLKVSSNVIKIADKVFLWSISHLNTFAKKFNFENKFIISGSPRYDLSKKPFVNIFSKECQEIKKKYKKYILVCCSFSFANYFIENTDYVKILKKQKVIKNQEDLNNFLIYKKINNESLHHFLEAIEEIAIKFKNIPIIIRPHPSENKKIYMYLTRKLSNVFLEYQYSIHSWIINSYCIIHNYCTSSSEALSLNIPRFALRRTFDSKVHKTIPYECSVVCETIPILLNKIENLVLNNHYDLYDNKLTKNNFIKYLHNIDSNFAYKIIVKHFCSFIAQGKILKKDIYYDSYLKFTKIIKNIIKIILFPFFYKKKQLDYINHKIPNINADEISNLFSTYSLISDKIIFSNFNFVECDKNIINITYSNKK